jgi:nitrite reductase (NADH) large subunit
MLTQPDRDIDSAVSQRVDLERLVIVGGGMAGFGLCDRLVKHNVAEAFDITLFGDEPQLAYDRVNLSKLFSGRTADDLQLADRQWYSDQQIKVRPGRRIVSIDRKRGQVIDDQGEATDYDRLVLATGSRAWVPPIPGSDLPGVFVYRTIDDLLAIQKHVEQSAARSAAVIGGGLLGLEAVKVMLDLNVDASVIEMAPGLMPRQLDATASKVLKERVESLGVSVMLTMRTESIQAVENKVRINFVEAEPLDVDILVVAAGIRPRDELAEDAGLGLGKRGGFTVNDRLQTNDPDIYAIGECASIKDYTYGLVAPCYLMADTLADQLAGVDSRFDGADESAELKLLGVPVVALGTAIGYSPDGVILTHQDEAGYRKLIVEFGKIVGAAGVGQWDDIDTVRVAVGRQRKISRRERKRFVETGRLSPPGQALTVTQWPSDATVCSCLGVTRGELSAAYENGAVTSDQLSQATGAGTGCGSCQHLVCAMAGGKSAAPETTTGTVVLVTSLVSLVLSLVIWFVPPLPMADSVQSDWRNIDIIWREEVIKQVSGYSLLAVSVFGMIFSLRKRTKLVREGSYGFWRAVHTAVGVATLFGLVAHTGMRLGANVNMMLGITFLALTFVGAAAGIASGLENRLAGEAAMVVREWRPRLTKLHIWLLWPLPVLIVIHIICVYAY